MDIQINADNIIEEIYAEAMEIADYASKFAAEKIKSELDNAYNKIIEDYYAYITTSYYRHNAGIGTGWGDNLYYSNHIELLGGINGYSGMIFDINTSGMAGYKKVSSGYVLDNVLRGQRGLPGQFKEFSTTVSVAGRSMSGAPNMIIDQLVDQAPIIYKKYWMNAWYSKIRTGGYSFFNNKKTFKF